MGRWFVVAWNNESFMVHGFIEFPTAGSLTHRFLDSLTYCWLTASLIEWFIASVTHWLTGSLNDWSIGLLSRCLTGSLSRWTTDHWFIASLLHWIYSLIRLFSGSPVYCFIASFRCAVILPCGSFHISTTICSLVDAPCNFNTSLRLHRKNFPIGHWIPMSTSYFWNCRPGTCCAPFGNISEPNAVIIIIIIVLVIIIIIIMIIIINIIIIIIITNVFFVRLPPKFFCEVSFTYFAVLNVEFWLQRSQDQWGKVSHFLRHGWVCGPKAILKMKVL